MWSTWDITEERAHELAKLIVDPRYAAGVTACACGSESRASCREDLVSIDILTATTSPKGATA